MQSPPMNALPRWIDSIHATASHVEIANRDSHQNSNKYNNVENEIVNLHYQLDQKQVDPLESSQELGEGPYLDSIALSLLKGYDLNDSSVGGNGEHGAQPSWHMMPMGISTIAGPSPENVKAVRQQSAVTPDSERALRDPLSSPPAHRRSPVNDSGLGTGHTGGHPDQSLQSAADGHASDTRTPRAASSCVPSPSVQCHSHSDAPEKPRSGAYLALYDPPFNCPYIDFSRFHEYPPISDAIKVEENAGLFIGQLPSSYTKKDIIAVLRAVAAESSCQVDVRDVKNHNRNRTCAFAIINKSALPLLVSYTRRLLCDTGCLWKLSPEIAGKVAEYILSKPKDSQRGVPTASIVLEELTPRGKTAHRKPAALPSAGPADSPHVNVGSKPFEGAVMGGGSYANGTLSSQMSVTVGATSTGSGGDPRGLFDAPIGVANLGDIAQPMNFYVSVNRPKAPAFAPVPSCMPQSVPQLHPLARMAWHPQEPHVQTVLQQQSQQHQPQPQQQPQAVPLVWSGGRDQSQPGGWYSNTPMSFVVSATPQSVSQGPPPQPSQPPQQQWVSATAFARTLMSQNSLLQPKPPQISHLIAPSSSLGEPGATTPAFHAAYGINLEQVVGAGRHQSQDVGAPVTSARDNVMLMANRCDAPVINSAPLLLVRPSGGEGRSGGLEAVGKSIPLHLSLDPLRCACNGPLRLAQFPSLVTCGRCRCGTTGVAYICPQLRCIICATCATTLLRSPM